MSSTPKQNEDASYGDRVECPDQLDAHVVDVGDSTRIHGYDVGKDLARNYGFADVLLLTMTGELPADRQARAFETALVLASPLSVAEAPVHVGVLAALCDAPSSRVLSTGALALAERTNHLLEAQSPLLSWLRNPEGAFPAASQGRSDADRALIKDLRSLLSDIPFEVQALEHHPCREAALIATFHACGIQTIAQLETVFVLAQLPCLAAEAQQVHPLQFGDYPHHVPAFRYEEDR